MQKSDITRKAVSAHRKVRSSTTLNRRYVKKPALSGDITPTIKRSPRIVHFSGQVHNRTAEEVSAHPMPARHPLQHSANQKIKSQKMRLSQSEQPTLSAREIKEQAIKKAIASANKDSSAKQKKTSLKNTPHFGIGRVVLALTCAAIVAFSIVYFVNLNMPDLSLRVAAMQTGIDASYPSYVPRNYSISSISSEEGEVVLEFHNSAENSDFTIVEEVSSWDSGALLANYVKEAFGDNYSTIREQGLTIYTSDSNAAWVNGGILYKINAKSGALSNKQIRSIAVSL